MFLQNTTSGGGERSEVIRTPSRPAVPLWPLLQCSPFQRIHLTTLSCADVEDGCGGDTEQPGGRGRGPPEMSQCLIRTAGPGPEKTEGLRDKCSLGRNQKESSCVLSLECGPGVAALCVGPQVNLSDDP